MRAARSASRDLPGSARERRGLRARPARGARRHRIRSVSAARTSRSRAEGSSRSATGFTASRSSTAAAWPSCRARSTLTSTRTRTGSAGSGTTFRSSPGCSSRTRCSPLRLSRRARSTSGRSSAGSRCSARARPACVDFLYELQGFTEESLEAVVSRVPRPRPPRGDRARDGRSRLPRDGRARRGARRAGPDRSARARPSARLARVGDVHAPRRRALPPARRGDLDLPGAVGAAALHRRDARGLGGARRGARPRDPHPRPRDPHAGGLGPRRCTARPFPSISPALGFLSPRVSFEHGIWLTPADIELVAAHGVTIVHNPVSNMKLGSGICPVPTCSPPA